jgi:hypothetical protein
MVLQYLGWYKKVFLLHCNTWYGIYSNDIRKAVFDVLDTGVLIYSIKNSVVQQYIWFIDK